MQLNLSELKKHSFQFDHELRFPISNLKINIIEKWKSFDNFVSLVELDSGMKFNIKLKDVLLDTGNETNYCVMSAYYLDIFKASLKNIEVEKKIMGTYRGTRIISAISTEIFVFTLFNCKFHSRIGITYQTSVNALDVINIGIKGLKQILNIIFPYGSDTFYFCQNV